MEKKIMIIVFALFAISILTIFTFYTVPNATAQLSFTTTNITYTGIPTENESQCEYLNSQEVWCSSNDGIKIINPTTRSIVSTLYSGIAINDVVCGGFCYSWHGGGSATANLTQWDISTHDIVNNRTFTMSGGGNLGRDIDVIDLQGAENILLPSSSTSCIGSGGTNLKGLCIWDGDIWNYTTRGFISSGDTGNSAALFGIKFAEVTDVFQANVLIFYQDGAGTRTLRILNLADSDSTFATTQICTPTSAAGLSAVNNIQIYVYENKFMFPFDNGATGLYLSTDIDSTTCATSTEFVTTWDIPSSLVTDGEFYYIGSTQSGATARSAVQVFNLTSSSSFATYNTTNTTAPALPLKKAWYHSTEGELQVLGNSRLLVFSVQTPSGSDFCEQPENFNLLRCILERGDTTPLVGASQLINQSGTNIVCQIGLIECVQDEDGNFTPNDPNIQTNGVGYIFLVVALGIMIGIFWVASRGDLGDIPTFVWVLATLSIVGIITAFDWIDPTILIIAVIAIIALATAKAKGIFGNSGLFAGET